MEQLHISPAPFQCGRQNPHKPNLLHGLQKLFLAFYRKNGFTTDDKETLKKIDKAIETNRTLTFFDVPPTIMYWQEKNK